MTGTQGNFELLEEGERWALRLLPDSLTDNGILAARPKAGQDDEVHMANYFRVWTRDACWVAIFMLLTGNPRFIRAVVASLESVAKRQGRYGMIPNFVSPDGTEHDTWYLGVIDSTLLWLILVDMVRKDGHMPPDWLEPEVQKALTWICCQELDQRWLLTEQPGSGIMDNRSDILGHSMYANVLWIAVKRRYNLCEQAETLEAFDRLFFPHGKDFSADELRREKVMLDTGFFLRYPNGRNTEELGLGLSYIHPDAPMPDEVQTFPHVLLVLAGLFDGGRRKEILRALLKAGAGGEHPGKSVLFPPEYGDPRVTHFIGRHGLNRKNRYWFGGAWTLIAGYLVAALVSEGMFDEAEVVLVNMAKDCCRAKEPNADEPEAWGFNEWFDAQTGEPLGVDGQTWSIAAFLLALQTWRERRALIRL